MNYQDIPQPEVRESNSEFSWFEWDRAKQEQDTGFLSLEPMQQDVMRSKLSERSAYRAEAFV